MSDKVENTEFDLLELLWTLVLVWTGHDIYDALMMVVELSMAMDMYFGYS